MLAAVIEIGSTSANVRLISALYPSVSAIAAWMFNFCRGEGVSAGVRVVRRASRPNKSWNLFLIVSTLLHDQVQRNKIFYVESIISQQAVFL